MLARQLKENGYRVVYFVVCHNGFKDYILDAGFEYLEISKNFEIEKTQYYINRLLNMHKEKNKKMPGSIRSYIWNKRIIQSVWEDVLGKMEEVLVEDLPDLVLLGPLITKYSIPFLKLKIPIMNLNYTLISFPTWRVPPVFSRIIPKNFGGIWGRLRNTISWSRILSIQLLSDFWDSFILSLAKKFPPNRITNIRKEIMKYDGRVRRSDYYYLLDVPMLITSPQEFDFPFAPVRPSTCYIGAGIYPYRKEKTFYWGGIDINKPIVYCTLGSYSKEWKYRIKLYKAVIEAVRQRNDWQLILQMADDADIEELSPFPSNVFVEKWVPHMEVLPHTSLMICHAGFGTVREAIYFGVPLIVFPIERDQPAYAARIVYHKLGLSGNIKKINPKLMHQLMERVSNDDSIHRSVKNMQQVFREQLMCEKGVEFIKNYLSHRNVGHSHHHFENE